MNDDQFARALLVGVGAVFARPYFERLLHWLADLVEKAKAWRERRSGRRP
jgi:hypothetical protein